MAEVKWIKIVTDLFDDEKILMIEQLPEADSIIVIWFKILTLAGKINNGGVLIFNDKIPYTDEMLSVIFRRKISTIRLALQVLEDFGMIETINNAVTIPNWSKHQTMDKLENRKEYMKLYMQEYREKQKQKALSPCKVNGKANSKANVNSLEEEIDKDKDIDKDNKENIFAGKSENFIKTFEEYRKIRTSIKAKMTPYAEKRALMKVETLSKDEVEQIDILNQSIENSWKALYPLKKDTVKPKPSNFNNFEQRNTDFEKTENDLLGWIKNGTKQDG